MNRFATVVLLVALAGCGGGDSKELPPTTDPEAIKREQQRLRGEIPGAAKVSGQDPVKAEQDRLRGKP